MAMASRETPDETRNAAEEFDPPVLDHPIPRSAKTELAQSVPDPNRRHSLPLHFLPPGIWSANTSTASLVESEEAARGEHILDEATVANRISALRQLNGATPSRHRYAKSTGARSSTFSQPVIVRTYSGAGRPGPQQRDVITVKKEMGLSARINGKMELKLPPVEAFTFKGIMEEIRHGVAEDLERIAEICARSKYSLSNQYEVHMPPHGHGEPFLQRVGLGVNTTSGSGPTLQAIFSDDEGSRPMERRSRGGRRTKSVAYGTLETIMSSSRSSDEDKTKKKPAAVIAEEVRGRASKKEIEAALTTNIDVDGGLEARFAERSTLKHTRSRSATFASMIIDNAQGFKNDISSHPIPQTSLISEPARPQTSITTDMGSMPALDEIEQARSPTLHSFMLSRAGTNRHASMSSTLRPELETRPSIFGGFGSWLPWSRSPAGVNYSESAKNRSHAEGKLRELLKSADIDRKGKGVDRTT